jgi:hypothetical protein
MTAVVGSEKEKRTFYEVNINGKVLQNVEDAIPPDEKKPYWFFQLKNKETVWASGNIFVRYGTED